MASAGVGVVDIGSTVDGSISGSIDTAAAHVGLHWSHLWGTFVLNVGFLVSGRCYASTITGTGAYFPIEALLFDL